MLGRTLAAQSRYVEAEAEYRKAIAEYPSSREIAGIGSGDVYDALAVTLVCLGKQEEAEALVLSDLKRHPGNADHTIQWTLKSSVKLAHSLMAAGKNEQARDLIRRVLEQRRGEWPAKDMDHRDIELIWKQLQEDRP